MHVGCSTKLLSSGVLYIVLSCTDALALAIISHMQVLRIFFLSEKKKNRKRGRNVCSK